MLRSRLKWGLLVCLGLVAGTGFAQFEGTYSVQVADLLYFVEAGFAVSAVAISLMLVATI